jgi:hypothetical protein
MTQLLRGEATEFVRESEKAIEEDAIFIGWDITLKNCQVILKGIESIGMKFNQKKINQVVKNFGGGLTP